MVTTFQEHAKMLKVAPDAQERCWINVTTPTHTELQRLQRTFGIPMEFLTAALDPDERARVESEEGFQLILIRIPVRDDETEIPYYTHPLAIILGESIAVTVCTIESSVISDFIETKIKNFTIESHSRFVLQIFYRTALKYLKFLKEIERETTAIEQQLHTSLQNEELLRLLRYEKSLVYFTTSLRSNHLMMERLKRMSFLRLAIEDRELLEDVIIDNSQAIEMANIHTNILSGLMDAYASVINNNMNQVMKTLTKITIVLMIPTLIASIYGMNIQLPFQNQPNAFVIIVSLAVILTVLVIWMFNRIKIFK